MANAYYDRRGAEITRDMWKELHSDLDACVVAYDEIETENVKVKTQWFGIGPDVNSPRDIYTTTVCILSDVMGEFKINMDVSGIMESVHVSTEADALIVHGAVVERVYRGYYRTVVSAALGRLEPRGGSEG
jgi:hypothetical protein